MEKPLISPNKSPLPKNHDRWEEEWPDNRRPHPYEDYAPGRQTRNQQRRPPRYRENH